MTLYNVSSRRDLFQTYTLKDVLEGRIKDLAASIQTLPRASFDTPDIEKMVKQYVDACTITPVQLQENDLQRIVTTIQVDARDYPRRHVLDPSKPCYVPGIQIEYRLPFSGISELFRCQPESFDPYTPPFVTAIEDGVLVLVLQQIDTDVEAIQTQFNKTVASIRAYLTNMEVSLASFNMSLPERSRNLILKQIDRWRDIDDKLSK